MTPDLPWIPEVGSRWRDPVGRIVEVVNPPEVAPGLVALCPVEHLPPDWPRGLWEVLDSCTDAVFPREFHRLVERNGRAARLYTPEPAR